MQEMRCRRSESTPDVVLGVKDHLISTVACRKDFRRLAARKCKILASECRTR